MEALHAAFNNPDGAIIPKVGSFQVCTGWAGRPTLGRVCVTEAPAAQEYVVADDVIGNLGSRVLARCELREVQKIALLDMRCWRLGTRSTLCVTLNTSACVRRLMNLDRNEANILVKFTGANRNSGRITLVPIDHGYCLPDCLEVSEIDWVWYNYPQVKVCDVFPHTHTVTHTHTHACMHAAAPTAVARAHAGVMAEAPGPGTCQVRVGD
jgi:hypothetical protein